MITPRRRAPSRFALLSVLLAVCLAAFGIGLARAAYPTVPKSLKIKSPGIALAGMRFTFGADVTWPANATNDLDFVDWEAYQGSQLAGSGRFDKGKDGVLQDHVLLEGITLPHSGWADLTIVLKSSSTNTSNSTTSVPAAEELFTATHGIQVIPGFTTIIPIFVTLSLSFATRQVLLSLWCGVFLSSTIINGGNVFFGFLRTIDKYMVGALAGNDHAKGILFTWFLTGMLGLILRSGGAQGLARAVGKVIKDRWSAQWATFGLGCLIFFDDYTSALVVGSNMRIITDLTFLSHEKLAFLVHATSSGPASIAPMSSWIGFELLLIQENLPEGFFDRPGADSPFNLFMKTIPTRFFPILLLATCVSLIAFKKDFGPMLYAERRAHRFKKLMPDGDLVSASESGEETMSGPEGKPQRWYNAVLPIVVMVTGTTVGLFVTGYYNVLHRTPPGKEPDLSPSNIVGNGASFDSLAWSSFFALVFTIILYLAQRLMTYRMIMTNLILGIKDITESLLILALAWSIGTAFQELQVARYIVGSLGTSISPGGLPALVFVISCIISFSTGTSWGTMSIVFPLALPLADSIGGGEERIIIQTISAILTGSIFGDQCSPISDTSILSSLSSRISVQRHVETQLPYAIMVAGTSLFVSIPAGYGVWPGYVSLLIGIVLCAALVWLLGTRVESDDRSKLWLVERYFMKNADDMGCEKKTDFDVESLSMPGARESRKLSMLDSPLEKEKESRKLSMLDSPLERENRKRSVLDSPLESWKFSGMSFLNPERIGGKEESGHPCGAIHNPDRIGGREESGHPMEVVHNPGRIGGKEESGHPMEVIHNPGRIGGKEESGHPTEVIHNPGRIGGKEESGHPSGAIHNPDRVG
ncbi:hypothetical protein HK102_005780, partial [Quaeritorhiza haematococci]